MKIIIRWLFVLFVLYGTVPGSFAETKEKASSKGFIHFSNKTVASATDEEKEKGSAVAVSTSSSYSSRRQKVYAADAGGTLKRKSYADLKQKSSSNVHEFWGKEKVSSSADSNQSGPKRTSKPPKKLSSRKIPTVELYTTSWCGYCEKARLFFRSQGIAFREYDIEADQAAAVRKNELGGSGGVPFAIINGRKIQGYSQSAYLSALNQ